MDDKDELRRISEPCSTCPFRIATLARQENLRPTSNYYLLGVGHGLNQLGG